MGSCYYMAIKYSLESVMLTPGNAGLKQSLGSHSHASLAPKKGKPEGCEISHMHDSVGQSHTPRPVCVCVCVCVCVYIRKQGHTCIWLVGN